MNNQKVIKPSLDNLQLSDVYSLMLFALYKVQDVADYAVLSELCYLLDGNNLTRLLTYFAGQTITFPTQEDFVTLTNAMLLYQYINVDGVSMTEAQNKLEIKTPKAKEKATELYVRLVPIMNAYNIDRKKLK